MIELVKDLPPNVIGAVCTGRVTRKDYEQVLIPAVESTVHNNKRVRLYYKIAADFQGIDPMAVLEDFMEGMRHLPQWERIAVVTDVDWIKHTIKAFAFLIHGQLKTFPLAEAETALKWITESA